MTTYDERLLVPDLEDHQGGEFWQWCARGELRVQQCSDCGRRRFPPRPGCPWCHHPRAEWVPLSGRGTVWSVSIPHPPLLPAYAEQAPFNVIVVEAEEDPTIRFVGNLVTGPGARLDEIDPHTVEIGEAVTVVFDPIAEGIRLPRWRRRR